MDRPQANRPRKLDDRGEAHLIGSWPGAGSGLQPSHRRGTTGPCACWPGRWWSWGWRPPCHFPKALKKTLQAVAEEGAAFVSAEFVANMEDVLDLYAEPHDPHVRWSALTSPPCWPRPGRRSRPGRDVRCARTNTAGRVPATSSWPVSRWRAGGMWQ